ncbi:energy transducer TonB [Rhodohalobacter sp. 8-1]|uniref:energy transducer TonB n=1 Tax=Rhodohalobacter sp. 8-1 TaxID=3131972 RepID=UPI0030EB9F04
MDSGITKGITYLKAGLMVLLAAGSFTLLASENTMAQSSEEVFTVVDEMPEMIGGAESLYGEIKYPRAAARSGIEGRVFIQFVVDKDGNVRDEKVLRDIGGGCGEAALEAVREVKFTPGKKDGVAVNVQYSMPVTFKLENG